MDDTNGRISLYLQSFDPVRTRAIEEGAFKWFSMDRAIKVLDSFSREAAPPSLKASYKFIYLKHFSS